jgi:hypothetical protein
MTTKTYVKSGGIWRPSKEIYVKYGGTWRTIEKAWHKTAGVWQLVHNRIIQLNLIISSNTKNYNVKTAAEALYGGPINSPAIITLTVNPGVIVGSVVTYTGLNQNQRSHIAGPALSSGTFLPGSVLNIYNYGYIVGAGGQGGTYATPTSPYQAGFQGGNAIETTLPTNIYNYGIIAGGGGGGAGGDGAGHNSIGGGGGAGDTPGIGGFGYGGFSSFGQSGTLLYGGVGTHDPIYISTGGNLGQAGIYGGGFNSTGITGAPGYYIVGNSYVTWVVPGDRRGLVS